MLQRNRICYLLILLCLASWVKAQQRVMYTVNDGWRFMKGSPVEAMNMNHDDSNWDIVNLPHTWNVEDGDDEEPGMYRGPAWYRRHLFVDESQKGRRAILYFEGANQEVRVYLNGDYIGEHKGGYTRFCFDVTSRLRYGSENVFAIEVDNSYNPQIPPLSADFTFYGGIYRDVYLLFTNPIHLAVNDYASSGVYIRTPQVSHEKAVIDFSTLITNDSLRTERVIVEHAICDAQGSEIQKTSALVILPAGKTTTHEMKGLELVSPHLWDIDDPYCYRVYTRIYDKKHEKLLDEVSNPLGLRWFSFDSDKGFFLNGKHRKLIGTARHQDYFKKGNALSDEMHVRDVLLLKQMGGNFLRVSHYPQDPTVMEMCDKLGIVTSVEIPVVNAVTEDEAFVDNCVRMAREMIRQDFNRPSVMIWGYMNEILLRCPYQDESELEKYYRFTEKTARTLEAVIRQEDPSRYTMMAYHNAPEKYEAAHLTDIPMIQGWNLYQGWYEPDINEFQRLLDRAHVTYEDKVLFVTEYGPGVDTRLHSYMPERFDFSQEYGLIYHRHYLSEINKRAFIAGASLWNLNDFYSEPRMDVVPHVNNKGIVGLDRELKDVYLFYQAALSSQAMLMIGNREWHVRGGVVNTKNGSCIQSVPVFSNAKEVELFVNGQSLGKRVNVDGTVLFEVPFVGGRNRLEAKAVINGKEMADYLDIDFQLYPERLDFQDFAMLNVMLGSPRYFEDRIADRLWLPEQPYKAGSWGYIGGYPYRRDAGGETLLGSDIDILGTEMDPIFQTQRVGLEAFRADVPDGEYSVYLYWAELDSNQKREALIYNLGADSEQKSTGDRAFGVTLNGMNVIEDLNLARDYGYARAVVKKFIVSVKNGQGLTIGFVAKEGEPVLNSLSIYKNY